MPRAVWAPGAVAAALIVVLGFDEGGYAATSWVWSAALLAVAAWTMIAARPGRPGPLELVFLAAIAALLLWTLLSALWSLDPTGALLDAERLVLYLAAAVALLLAGRPESRLGILIGVLAGISAVCVAGLADAVIGDDAVGPTTHDPGSEDRLAEPIGYANGLALMAAMGVLLAAGLARVTRGVARLACIALVPLLVATLYLTYSRGGWLALALGLVGAAAFALRRLDRRVAAVVATGAIAAAVVAGVAVARSFDKATATPVSGAGRLTTLSGSSRTDYWRVAARDVADHPVLGSGAASYGRYWARERPVPQPARDAHSLPLETLAELGPLGLALLVVAFGAPILAGIRTRDDPLTPPAFGALVAFVAHAAQDWDWELPAVTVPAIACAVVLLLGARAREAPLAPMARRAGAGAAAVLAILAVAAYAGNRELALAEEGSESAARRASRLQPWSAAPLRALGEAQLSRGEVEQARETFLDALERDDGDWELWLDLALASEGAERDTALARAAELNPLAPEIDELRAEG